MATSPPPLAAQPAATSPRRPGLILPIVAAALVAGLVVFGVALPIESSRSAQESRNDFLRAEVARLDSQIKDIAALRAEIEALLARRKIEPQWTAQQRWPAQVLRLLAESRSGTRVWFEQAGETPAGLRLRGTAESYGEMERLVAGLQASPAVEKLDLVELRPDPGAAAVRFTLVVAVPPAWRPLTRADDAGGLASHPGDPK